MFPPAMLAKLFVKGSLKNTEAGVEMKLKNIIESGTVIGLSPLTIDETAYEPSAVRVKVGNVEVSGDQITSKEPVEVRSYAEIRLTIPGARLEPGPHKISIGLISREAGKLQFSVTETLAP